MSAVRPIDIVVPFYRNPGLVRSLFESFQRCRHELVQLHCRVTAINDSPDDPELEEALAAAAQALPDVPVTQISNPRNLGFVKSANLGFARSRELRHDVLLLNSDVLLFPGALPEMARIAAQDEMIGFVSPRSNNATICSLPHQEHYRRQPPEEAYAAFARLSRYLPEYHFVPTAVGFCLLIKAEILAEFGGFDEAYGEGYNEENDLIMRANRCGYQAALANRAFVYHLGEVSFKSSDEPRAAREQRNAAVLAARYPEYPASVERYLGSAHFEAERMLTALLPREDGRLDLVFDFSTVGTYYCGTFEVAKQLLAHALERWQARFHIHVLVSEEAKRFHLLDRLPRAVFVPLDCDKTFAIAFRPGQPFQYGTLARMSRLGVVNVYLMNDTIAYDCLYLREPQLHDIWSFVMTHADGVVYVSDFVRRQFDRRFRKRSGLKECVAYHSVEPGDYTGAEQSAQGGAGRYILVIGNKFAHKLIAPTAAALAAAFPDERIVAFGLESCSAPNVTCRPSGQLSEQAMDDLYRHAAVVVYPSLYEGFGLPVVRALAFRRPVFARSIPPIRELQRMAPGAKNLHLFSSTTELIERLKAGLPAWQDSPADASEPRRYGWDAAVDDIRSLLEEALAAHSLAGVLVPRLEKIRSLRLAAPGRDAAGPTDLAGLELAGDLQQQLEQRELQLADIRRSWSWRLTAPLRTAGGWALKLLRR